MMTFHDKKPAEHEDLTSPGAAIAAAMVLGFVCFCAGVIVAALMIGG